MGKNIIQQEYELAKTKMFEEETFKDNTLVRITSDNVALAEAMIQNNSAYIKSYDRNAAPTERYTGSSAYWFMQLKKYIDGVCCEYEYSKLISSIVDALDRENSTHLKADTHGRDVITSRIIDLGMERLIELLRNPGDDFWLFDEIAKKTTAEKGARTNPSFASKFCHFACFYLFEGGNEQDNYPILDSVIKRVLPIYLERFEIGNIYKIDDYKEYVKAIDAILNVVKEREKVQISRNGLDQLLWYYHKARK